MAVSSATQTLSTTAARLADRPVRYGIVLRNDDASITVLVGNSSSQDFEILAGTGYFLPCRNANEYYVKSASGTPVVQVIGN